MMTTAPLEDLALPIISCVNRGVSIHRDYSSYPGGLKYMSKRALRKRITEGGILIGSNLNTCVEAEPVPTDGKRIKERLGDPFSFFFPDILVPIKLRHAFGPVKVSLEAAKIIILSTMYASYDVWDSGAEPFEYYQQKLIDARNFQEICDELFPEDEIVE